MSNRSLLSTLSAVGVFFCGFAGLGRLWSAEIKGKAFVGTDENTGASGVIVTALEGTTVLDPVSSGQDGEYSIPIKKGGLYQIFYRKVGHNVLISKAEIVVDEKGGTALPVYVFSKKNGLAMDDFLEVMRRRSSVCQTPGQIERDFAFLKQSGFYFAQGQTFEFVPGELNGSASITNRWTGVMATDGGFDDEPVKVHDPTLDLPEPIISKQINQTISVKPPTPYDLYYKRKSAATPTPGVDTHGYWRLRPSVRLESRDEDSIVVNTSNTQVEEMQNKIAALKRQIAEVEKGLGQLGVKPSVNGTVPAEALRTPAPTSITPNPSKANVSPAPNP